MFLKRFIVFVGADGSGKTTLIDGVSKALQDLYDNESYVKIYHFRPTILPNLGALGERTRLMKQDTDFTNPHRAKPVGRLNSILRLTYYWVDYFFGIPYLMFKNKKAKLIIYDRYIYDFLVDPNRSRIKLPYWTRKIFTKMVLQPQIVFVLLTDAKTIYNRKQELSLNDIKRQLKEFKKLAQTSDRFVILDASKTPGNLVQEATSIIMNRFRNKVQ